jgi:germination protein YpeB
MKISKENGYNDYKDKDYIKDSESDYNKRDFRTRPAPRGMVIAIVVLSMLLSAASLIALNMYGTKVYFQNQLENQYQRSFYDLVANVSNLEIKLSKLLISNSDAQIQKNLNEVARQTESTQINLSQLPTTHETIYKTMRFVNQLGDYSNVLANTIAAGGKLRQDDYTTLDNLYQVNKQLSVELSNMVSMLGNGLKLVYSKTGDFQANPLSDGLGKLQDSAIDYPSMIYDGPFSDGLLNAEIKGLLGSDVTKEEAENKLAEYFKGFSIKQITFTGETEGKIHTYNYDVQLNNGETMFVQMSKIGGYPVQISNKRPLDNFTYDVKGCIAKAEEFVEDLGYDNMKSVWASDYSGYVFVNLAPLIDGVIYYPDLIKVLVARDNGEVLGLETQTYLTNHTDRNTGTPSVTRLEARNSISSKLKENIVSEKLVVIPRDGGKEVLAWEIASTWNDLKYFVYIDANTGKEIEIFRVIDSEEGTFIV